MTSPCRFCKNRHQACHATCNYYAEYERRKQKRYKNNSVARLGDVNLTTREYKIRAAGIMNDSRGRRDI